ncbi:glycosyltransferase family 2 protein [Methylobacterium sp. JK268]
MIVIPMAGLSQRFRNAGYALPKYMLDLHGRSLFERTVGSFAHYFATEPFLFIARHEAETEAFIGREVARMGVARMQVVMLSEPTLGQADTVRLGLEGAGVAADEPVTIFNIDTIRPGFRYPDRSWMAQADGYLEVMDADDPGYSYARPHPDGDERVAETAEKRVISRLASTGLYYFRRAGDYHAAFEAERRAPSAPELYVAPMYNAMIAQGRDVRFHEVPVPEVLFCGTPAQYEDLQKRPDLFAEA